MGTELVSFGDIGFDLQIRVRRLPKANEKLWAQLIGEFHGGMGANTAASFATLGGRAALVSTVGTDSRGDSAISDLDQLGVDTSAVRRVPGPTFWAVGLVGRTGEKSMVMVRTPTFSLRWAAVDWDVLDGDPIVHAAAEAGTDLGPLLLESKRRGLTIALDAEPSILEDSRVASVTDSADILFCGPTVARALGRASSVRVAGRRLATAGKKRIVAVMLGRHGCLVSDATGLQVSIPGHRIKAVDTTGAGDCFVGAFLYAHSRGWPLEARAELANLMAAISVTAPGARGRLLSLSELAELPEARGLRFKDLIRA